jgi:hypothetical protein
MRPGAVLTHEFVDSIPEQLREGTVYVCVRYATVVHRCCCGCGREVVTPLSPTDWTLLFDGASVSLRPSIGNWNFPCQSHYWIQHDRVRWAGRWSREQIEAGRAADALAKAQHFGEAAATHEPQPPVTPAAPAPGATTDAGKPAKAARRPWWRAVFARLFGG